MPLICLDGVDLCIRTLTVAPARCVVSRTVLSFVEMDLAPCDRFESTPTGTDELCAVMPSKIGSSDDLWCLSWLVQ
jgi:hypothetical protein